MAVKADCKRRLLEMLRAERLPFFGDLSDESLKGCLRESKLELGLEAGAKICQQGEVPHCFYVLVAGSVLARRDKAEAEAEGMRKLAAAIRADSQEAPHGREA